MRTSTATAVDPLSMEYKIVRDFTTSACMSLPVSREGVTSVIGSVTSDQACQRANTRDEPAEVQKLVPHVPFATLSLLLTISPTALDIIHRSPTC